MKIKIYFKQLICRHKAKRFEQGDKFDRRRDPQKGPYLLRKCIKCGKLFRDYHIKVE